MRRANIPLKERSWARDGPLRGVVAAAMATVAVVAAPPLPVLPHPLSFPKGGGTVTCSTQKF